MKIFHVIKFYRLLLVVKIIFYKIIFLIILYIFKYKFVKFLTNLNIYFYVNYNCIIINIRNL
jgi:hypothetical protein